MFDEDLPKKAAAFTPLVLDTLSVDELEEYIQDLEGEIARVREDIAKKEASKAAAENVFK